MYWANLINAHQRKLGGTVPQSFMAANQGGKSAAVPPSYQGHHQAVMPEAPATAIRAEEAGMPGEVPAAEAAKPRTGKGAGKGAGGRMPVREGMLPRGRPAGAAPTVSHVVANKIDKARSVDDISAKIAVYMRAKNLMTRGYVKSSQLNVVRPPDFDAQATAGKGGLPKPDANREVAGNLDARMAPAQLKYELEGNSVGVNSSTITNSNRAAAAAAPARFRDGDGYLPVTAGNGIDESTGYGAASVAPGALPARLAHDVGAVVIEEEGPMERDTVAEVAAAMPPVLVSQVGKRMFKR